MKSHLRFILALFLITATLAISNVSAQIDINNVNKDVLRFKFKESYTQKLDQLKSKSLKYFANIGIDKLDQLNTKYHAIQFRRLFPDAGKFEQRHREYRLHLWYEIEFDNSIDTDIFQRLAEYQNLTAYFDYVELNYKVSFNDNFTRKDLSDINVTKLAADAPNDLLFDYQWHYHNTGQTGGTPGADIDLLEAWDLETGSTDVIVAVIDGGIYIDHPDLIQSLWVNEAENSGTAGVDDDGNGYVDDVHGYSFVKNSPVIGGHFHGTHVAGTIGAVNNNSIGVSGIAGGSSGGNGVRLMSCAVFGSILSGGFAEAFAYAADNGAVIAQNSWGYNEAGYYEQAVKDAIDYFIDNAGKDLMGNQTGPMKGGLVVFAAGNDGTDNQWYPAYYDGVMAVAATDHNDVRASFSNYGAWVDVAAPGVDVVSTSTSPYNIYDYMSGTSMACPHTSGVAALMVSHYQQPGLRPDHIWGNITLTAENIDAQNPAYIGKLGAGRINAFNALQLNDGIAPARITDLTDVTVTDTSVTLQWTATGASGSTGKAYVYDMRYTDLPLPSATYEDAIVVTGLPRPALSGTLEEFTVTGLSSSTEYHFAIRAIDFFGLGSPISNIVTITTGVSSTAAVPESIVGQLINPKGN